MSFSSEIKEEISKVNNLKNKNILKAELFGYLLTANVEEKDDNFEFITENEFNIERIYKILFNLEIDYEPKIEGKCFVAVIPKKDCMEKVVDVLNDNTEEIHRAIIKGVFLGAGSITDPNKAYHLEISFNKKSNADIVYNICHKYNIILKFFENNERINLYIKEGEEISKFLAFISANRGVMTFEDVRITREIKNNVNRTVNCETANLNKIVNASLEQVNDINLIKAKNKFEELPDELKEIANLRIENPELSLKALGELLENPIGKSGVNHRLQKIHKFAEELKG